MIEFLVAYWHAISAAAVQVVGMILWVARLSWRTKANEKGLADFREEVRTQRIEDEEASKEARRETNQKIDNLSDMMQARFSEMITLIAKLGGH